MDTGLYDKNGTPINIGDRTRLVLDDGEIREFDVCFKTVKRTTIKTLRGFSPETADVSITGIFFCWEGNDLLPCVDENGVSDVSKMEVIKRAPRREVVSKLPLKYEEGLYIGNEIYGLDEDYVRKDEKIVKCRESHECYNCNGEICPGDYAVYETGFMYGKPLSTYTCIECMEEWMKELGRVEVEDENL